AWRQVVYYIVFAGMSCIIKWKGLPMNYRQLTVNEIMKLGQEIENYQRWEAVRDYVFALYGPQAHQVTYSVISAYNDSNYDEELAISIADHGGVELPYDFALPWWRQFDITEQQIAEFTEHDEHSDYGAVSQAWWDLGDTVNEALRNFTNEKLGVEFLEHWERFDPISWDFVLSEPPVISFPQVFVAE
ncbi:MAG TPA: hypothetical protein VKB76_13360, partial [Ktedonobacterales bacterium]|nr:hypothetical protein [Ktedonobacterales bacterium]